MPFSVKVTGDSVLDPAVCRGQAAGGRRASSGRGGRKHADLSRAGELSVLGAACLRKDSFRKGIDYRILQKGHLSFLLSKDSIYQDPPEVCLPSRCGGGRSEEKDGEAEMHLRSVLLRVRQSPPSRSIGGGGLDFYTPRGTESFS